MIEFFGQALTIAGKDLRSELRNKEVMNAAVSFTVVVLLLFSFAFERMFDTDVRGHVRGPTVDVICLPASLS